MLSAPAELSGAPSSVTRPCGRSGTVDPPGSGRASFLTQVDHVPLENSGPRFDFPPGGYLLQPRVVLPVCLFAFEPCQVIFQPREVAMLSSTLGKRMPGYDEPGCRDVRGF